MHSNFQSQSKSQWRLAVLFCAVGVLVAAPRGTGAPVIAPNAGTTAPGRAASATKAREQRPDDAAGARRYCAARPGNRQCEHSTSGFLRNRCTTPNKSSKFERGWLRASAA